MPSRAPLFSVSVTFALGCVVGLDHWLSLKLAVVLLPLTGLLWWRTARHETLSLIAFYLLTACAGLAHTLLVSSTIAPHDLRRLPEDKTYPTTQWRGVVNQEPVAQTGIHTSRAAERTSFVFHVEGWRPTEGRFFQAPISTPWQSAQGDVLCTLVGPARDLQCGDRLEMAMALTPIPPPLTPGALDFRAYEAEQGIFYQATVSSKDWRRVEKGAGNFWQNFSYRARDWAYARLQIGLEDDPRVADFLAGMLIGYRQEIPLDIEQDFRRTGTLHIFAVSGQNIAELMVVALVLLQLFGLVRWKWAWTLAPIVLVYCLLTGSPASAVRATLMIFAILAAWRLGRPLNGLGCWSLALLMMLVWNPVILLDPGAQLSFGVVLGLILLGPPLARLFQRPFLHDDFLPTSLLTPGQKREEAFWHRSAQILSATLAATLVSEPITAVDFHQVTPISVFANLVVVPVAGLITVVGTLAVTFSLFSTLWAALLNNANWLLARLLIAFVGFLAREPGASLNVPDVRAINDRLPLFVVAPLQDSACLLVRTSDQTWLFNTGRETTARAATSHLLQFYGINRLDGLVLAQMSTSDNSGAEIIVRSFHPKRLILSALRSRSPVEKTLAELGSLQGQPFELWHEGQSFALGSGVTCEVLNPAMDAPAGHGEDRALVLLFHSGDEQLLWAGKIDSSLQQRLLSRKPSFRADVLVLDPDANPSPEWLRQLKVQDWLQIPRRDRQTNESTASPDDGMATTTLWPLSQTGAVEIHFISSGKNPSDTIQLKPWLTAPQVGSSN